MTIKLSLWSVFFNTLQFIFFCLIVSKSIAQDCDTLLSDRTLNDVYAAYGNSTLLNEIDADGDFLHIEKEQCLGSDPNNQDTDGDGISDSSEFLNHLDPTSYDLEAQLDLDGDGLIFIDELKFNTDPSNADSDNDGSNDGYEVFRGYGPNSASDSPDSPRNYGGNDFDKDSIPDYEDICPFDPFNNIDNDFDHLGNPICANLTCEICEIGDCPPYCNNFDNCPGHFNPDQLDANNDGTGDSCQCGDLNSDGQITIADRDLIAGVNDAEIYVGASPLTLNQLQNCDVNSDGLCSVADYERLDEFLSDNQTWIAKRCADLTTTTEKAMSRIGYGHRNSQAWRYSYNGMNLLEMGLWDYVEEQLNPNLVTNPDSQFENIKASYSTGLFPVVNQSYQYLRDHYCNTAADCLDRKDHESRIPKAMAELKALRSIYSEWQLDAVLSDFWFNHFNVDANNSIGDWLIPEYQKIIDENMYGRFEDLLMAVTEAPSMMVYLTLNNSLAGNPNLNYAREVMELHTIGPDGTYDEDDVFSVARILTGYQIPNLRNAGNYDTNVVFNLDRHDQGSKEITLGSDDNNPDSTWYFGSHATPSECEMDNEPSILAETGKNEIVVLMCLLARHEKTAINIGKKLIRRFLGDNAIDGVADNDNPLLSGFINKWKASKGDLRKAVKYVLLAGVDNSINGSYFERSLYLPSNKVKRPLVYSASIARAYNVRHISSLYMTSSPVMANVFEQSIFGVMGNLFSSGDALFRIGPPTGYPEKGIAWQGNSSVLSKFALTKDLILEGTISNTIPIRYVYRSFWDSLDNEWLGYNIHNYPHTVDNNQLVHLLADHLLPGNGINYQSHEDIVTYLNENFDIDTSDNPDAVRRSYEMRADAASALIMTLPRAFYQ